MYNDERLAHYIIEYNPDYADVIVFEGGAVSYTHLDVYKRQEEPEQDLEPEADGDEDPQSEKAEKPEYSDKMRLTELQALAGAYGLDAQNMRTKAEVIKLLDDYFAEEDDTEAPPAFGAMDPVE